MVVTNRRPMATVAENHPTKKGGTAAKIAKENLVRLVRILHLRLPGLRVADLPVVIADEAAAAERKSIADTRRKVAAAAAIVVKDIRRRGQKAGQGAKALLLHLEKGATFPELEVVRRVMTITVGKRVIFTAEEEEEVATVDRSKNLSAVLWWP